MNKKNCLKGIIAKPIVLAIVSAVLFVASILVAIFAGFNTTATLDSASTLTIRMYKNDYVQKIEVVEDVCEKAFAGKVEANFKKNGETSGLYSEIVYVFDENANLATVKTNIKKVLGDKDIDADVTIATEKVAKTIPASHFIRMGIATTVFAVLAFLYVAFRHKFAAGLAYAISLAIGSALTFAIVTLVRIPVSSAIAYIVSLGMVITAVIAMLNYRKMIEAEKAYTEKKEAARLAATLSVMDEETVEQAEETEEFSALDSLAVKETVWFVSAITVALVLMLAFGPANIRLFALNSVLAVICATFAGLIVAPSLYIPFKKNADKKQAERARYDYKKAKKLEKEEQ